MKHIEKNIRTLAVVMLLFFTMSCSNKPNDQEIQDNVTKQLESDQNYAGVAASVKNGVVTLSGTCEGEDCPATIEAKIKEVDGVRAIENTVMKHTATDLATRTSVQNIVSRYPGVQADVTSGVIVLRGTIDKDNLQSLMNELHTLNPEKIDNQLSVQ